MWIVNTVQSLNNLIQFRGFQATSYMLRVMFCNKEIVLLYCVGCWFVLGKIWPIKKLRLEFSCRFVEEADCQTRDKIRSLWLSSLTLYIFSSSAACCSLLDTRWGFFCFFCFLGRPSVAPLNIYMGSACYSCELHLSFVTRPNQTTCVRMQNILAFSDLALLCRIVYA